MIYMNDGKCLIKNRQRQIVDAACFFNCYLKTNLYSYKKQPNLLTAAKIQHVVELRFDINQKMFFTVLPNEHD